MKSSRPALDTPIVIVFMRVLIVPDKFKGTLTARQAAAALAWGWKRTRPRDRLDLLPMSDGGEGFGEVIGGLLGARPRTVNTVDAAHRPCRANWWWEPDTRTAVVESAEVIGLTRLPVKRFHPNELDTFGLGKVLIAAARHNPRRCIVGVGGSATNDGGFGLARALGWRFLGRNGEGIDSWPDLSLCQRIFPPAHRLNLGRLTVALDVQNPLHGRRGCTRTYGPQKGLRPGDFKQAETALRELSQQMKRLTHKPLDNIGGAGAAGGLGFGLMAFLKANPAKGFALFAREARLRERIRTADLVITGEGCLDQQSLMGKGIGELLALCGQRDLPCIAINGRLEASRAIERRFTRTYALTSLARGNEVLSRPAFWLSRAAAKAAEEAEV